MSGFAVVKEVVKGSIAEEGGVRPGDALISINGEPIRDIFDYRFHTSAYELELLFRGADGDEWILDVGKSEDEDVGLVFENELIDGQRACVNRCVFCFIDQLPKGLRGPLYFKDDDLRLSFTNGNYVTLTNAGQDELARIVRYRMSPVNISVHTTDAALRARMLGLGLGLGRGSADILPKIRYLTDAGIAVNAQIVLCKGYNDGESLDRTLADLGGVNAFLTSVSVVPSGLTRYRETLPPLAPFGASDAAAALRQLAGWQARFSESRGSRFVYPADEFFVLAGRRAPGARYYEGFPQLENGVGMLALFLEEFRAGLRALKRRATRACPSGSPAPSPVHSPAPSPLRPPALVLPPPAFLFTGEAAAGMLESCADALRAAVPGLAVTVVPVRNAFFGGQITVTGLLTGRDILDRAKKIKFPKNARIFLSKTMFRYGSDVFLDDFTLEKLRNELKVDIIAVENNGRDFVRAVTQA
ncbi:MAG: DUF512 domain-containing protein [Clostridiales bacterium]|jgi:putative radical SAM enzyme (TIGR03279 family)|nr:DUF512 domain-containing protein [Clostridiales bacterium]